MKKTYVCIALDRSGSMNRIRKQAIDGYNEHVQQLKADAEDQKGENEFFVSLITFTGKVYEHLWNVNPSELQEITEKDYKPDGATALYEAQGYAIEKLLETTDAEDPETSYLLIVITDGENTKVMNLTIDGLRELCNSVKEKGNWTITYMGCDGKYLEKHAIETGVPIANCAVWQNDSVGTKFAFSESRDRLRAYSASRKAGLVATSNYHNSNDGSMGDYTKANEAPSLLSGWQDSVARRYNENKLSDGEAPVMIEEPKSKIEAFDERCKEILKGRNATK